MSDSRTYPKERLRVFSRDRFPIAEFRATAERSLALGDESRLQFTYPTRKTEIANDTVLRFGNWILVESDTLPPWVGVIDTPRSFESRTVTVSAYSPEHVLGQRRGPVEQVFNTSPGGIFESIIQFVNRAEPTPLVIGNVYRGGKPMQETINPTPLSDDLRRIWERSGEDYAWRPTVENGLLTVYADWHERLGSDFDILLHEGKGGGNIEAQNRMLVEDGDIYNDILAYGDGMTWPGKPMSTVQDQESIGKYGLRQTARNWSGVNTVQGLTDNAEEEISNSKNASRTFAVTALNVGETFKYIGLGNTMILQLQNIGFQNGGLGYVGRVRIVGMNYDPEQKNRINLVVEEVL